MAQDGGAAVRRVRISRRTQTFPCRITEKRALSGGERAVSFSIKLRADRWEGSKSFISLEAVHKWQWPPGVCMSQVGHAMPGGASQVRNVDLIPQDGALPRTITTAAWRNDEVCFDSVLKIFI